ncbi:hypothetical protein HU200_049488 [Digitaria exilis]|uniref:F-box domain-containing protein n=1 Tax=Digitaria exilis TaxID=1010633 RepID=A0A835EBV1_9POAL|nr:hypothetical protein HU200_049488 [Digitaria exilis]
MSKAHVPGYSAATREHKLARLFCFVCDGGVPVATRCEVLVLLLDPSAHWRPSVQRLRIQGEGGRLPQRASPLAMAWSEVLRRLPARSIARLNLVCRDWHALISTDRFLRSHAVHAELNGASAIMFADCNYIGHATIGFPWIRVRLLPALPCGATQAYATTYATLLARRRVRVRHGHEQAQARLPLLQPQEPRDTGVQAGVRLVQNIRDGAWCLVDPPPPGPVANVPPVDIDGKLFWTVDMMPSSDHQDRQTPATRSWPWIHTCDFDVLKGPPGSCDGRLVSVLRLRGALGAAVHARQGFNTLEMWAMRGYGDGSWCMEYSVDLGKHSPEYSRHTTVPLKKKTLTSFDQCMYEHTRKVLTSLQWELRCI